MAVPCVSKDGSFTALCNRVSRSVATAYKTTGISLEEPASYTLIEEPMTAISLTLTLIDFAPVHVPPPQHRELGSFRSHSTPSGFALFRYIYAQPQHPKMASFRNSCMPGASRAHDTSQLASFRLLHYAKFATMSLQDVLTSGASHG